MNYSGARILALDVGERRIGIAISDSLGITAQGLPTLERRNATADMKQLADLARTREATMWLVGLPLHMSGREGRQADKVRSFGQILAERSGLPIVYWDERLTTVEAERVLRAAATSREKVRRSVDRLAAVILLQSYLDSQRWESQES